MVRCALILVLIFAVVAAGGCATNGDGGAASDDASISVPDVTGQDGADATSELEDQDFTVAYQLAGDMFDSSVLASVEDPAGCEVTDQDPISGSDAVSGDEITLTVDCRQRDWENQEGDIWDEFTSGWTDGFDAGCTDLFGLSPDATLYNDETEYTEIDCTNLNPEDPSEDDNLPADAPEDPESAGQELGHDAGCNALFDEELVDELYHGPDTYTAADCIGAASASAPKRRGDRRSTSSLKTSGQSCTGQTVNGKPVRIRVTGGKISCTGAAALWQTYLNDPREGTGSGGYLKVEGWDCIAASAARAPDQGGCAKGRDSFSVRGD